MKLLKLISGIVCGILILTSCEKNVLLDRILTDDDTYETTEAMTGGSGSIFVYESADYDCVSHLVSGGKLTDISVNGQAKDIMTTVDGSAGVFSVELINYEHTNLLYRFDKDSLDFIAFDVLSRSVSSSDGDVVYKTAEGLFFYDNETKESTLITDEPVESYAISPNGNCVVYLAKESTYSWKATYRLMRWMNGRTLKFHQLNEDYYLNPVGVPDSGEYVYASRYKSGGMEDYEYIYTVTMSSTETIEDYSGNIMLLNRTQEQLLYYADDENIVYLVKGKEKIPLYEENYVFTLNDITVADQYGTMPFKSATGYKGCDTWFSIIYDVEDFSDQTLMFCSYPVLSIPTVYFRTLTDYNVSAESPNYSLSFGDLSYGDIVVAEDVYWACSENKDLVFYVDKYDSLYVYSIGNESLMLEDEIDDLFGFINGKLYYTKDVPDSEEDQIWVHDGTSGSLIFEGNIVSIEQVRDSIYFYAKNDDGEVDFYGVVNGNKPKMILNNIIAH